MEKTETMKHTKEPWDVVSDSPVMAIYSEPEDYRVVQTVNQNNFNTYGKSRVDVGVYKQEDAERIVACVNACEGITNEALEAGVIQSALINFEESLGLEKGEQFCFYDIPVLEDV